MRPTLRAFALFTAGIPATLGLILFDASLWPAAPFFLGLATLLVGLDAILAPPPRRLTVEATVPPILYIGDSTDLIVSMSLADQRTGARVDVLCDVNDLLEIPQTVTASVRERESAQAAIVLRPTRRGQAQVERLWLRWRGPLGLFSKQRVIELDASIPVLPNLQAVRQAALHFSAWDALHGFKLQNQQGEGSEFHALRDWVPGLDHRSIDWKQSARHHLLVCKEFDVERNHHIILAFDTGHLMSEPLAGIPRLDHAVNASLLMAWASLHSGDRVGMFAFDSQVRQFTKPVGGRNAYARLQDAAADLDYRYEETNFTLGLGTLLGQLERRSLVIVQSDFVDTVTAELMAENLERLAGRHLVMFVALHDPDLDAIAGRPPESTRDMVRAVIADEFVHERRIVFERLRRLGVLCLEAPTGALGTEMVNRYMDVKRQELI